MQFLTRIVLHHQEVDWYACNVGSFHAEKAMDPAVTLTDDDYIQRLLLGDDRVLVRCAAHAVGVRKLEVLVTHYVDKRENITAAKIERAITSAMGGLLVPGVKDHNQAALALLEQSGEDEMSTELQQLMLDTLSDLTYSVETGGSEKKRVNARIEKLLTANTSLRLEPIALALARHRPRKSYAIGAYPAQWNDGCKVTVRRLTHLFVCAATQFFSGMRRRRRVFTSFGTSILWTSGK